jgi:hypothetical protein
MQFTGEQVIPDQIATDLPKTACDIHTAYFVIQGQEDVITPTQAPPLSTSSASRHPRKN